MAYTSTVAQSIALFATLRHILEVAQKHEDAASLPAARLCEDMKPLTFQIHSAAVHCDKMLVRLTGKEPVSHQDDLETYDDMIKRIDGSLEALRAADRDTVEELGHKVMPTVWGYQQSVADMSGLEYCMGTELTVQYFHVFTAYGILRSKGVPLGVRDYISFFIDKHIRKTLD